MSVRQIIKKLNSFTGVASDEQATLKIDGGPTIDEIVIDTQGSITTTDKIKLVSVVLNGEEIVRVTGEQLKMLERYKGLHSEADKFVIPFADITANTLEGQQLTGLVTLPTDNIVLNIELGTVTNPKLKAFAKMSPATVARHFIPTIRQLTFTPDAAGEADFASLQRGPSVSRIHWKGDNDAMRIVKDGITYMDATKAILELNQRRLGLIPQTGFIHLDFVAAHWNMFDKFRTDDVIESLIFKPNVKTVGSQILLVESLRLLDKPEVRI